MIKSALTGTSAAPTAPEAPAPPAEEKPNI
jgi:hypothetical protein